MRRRRQQATWASWAVTPTAYLWRAFHAWLSNHVPVEQLTYVSALDRNVVGEAYVSCSTGTWLESQAWKARIYDLQGKLRDTDSQNANPLEDNAALLSSTAGPLAGVETQTAPATLRAASSATAAFFVQFVGWAGQRSQGCPETGPAA